MRFFLKKSLTCFLIVLFYPVIANAKAPLSIVPIHSNLVQNIGSGTTVVNYLVTNQMKNTYTFAMTPITGVTQDTSNGFCGQTFKLTSKTSCILSLMINRSQITTFNDGPEICVAHTHSASGFMCSRPAIKDALKIATLDPNFPYSSAPIGNVCVSSDYYATPETMLGSWAMLEAVQKDGTGNVLPTFLNTSNVVYAVGTAAIGNELGLAGCGGGCNQLNGYCFALKFNGKTTYPYMIFQSVNIGANDDSFDIYMAGGGSGAFPGPCQTFWGTAGTVNWANHIEDSNCSDYFNNFSTINTQYSVTYEGVTHPGKETLENACAFASAEQSGFNTQNWSNVSVVPVTCPQSLVQITGVEIPSSITTIGNQSIHNLSTLTDNDFSTTSITGITTTQMQDCKTPSSGYCNNVPVSVTNYEASISASLSAPLLSGQPPSNTYCEQNVNAQYCSWNNGESSAGGSYCNANQAQCIQCGGGSKWCICSGSTLKTCLSDALGLVPL